MLRYNLKVVALTSLLLGAVATTDGFLTRAVAMKDEPTNPPAIPPPQAATNREPAAARPAPGRMLVTGRVLDPEGMPVSNATTMVFARFKEPGRGVSLEHMSPAPLGEAIGDRSGRFRLDAPRTASSRNDLFGAVALAPGYGVGWVELDPDAEQPTAEITLRSEQIIQGRLFDIQGQPARKVKVTVSSIGRDVDGKLDGPRLFWWNDMVNSLAWPRSVTSDDDGRFSVRGVGRNLQAHLTVDDPRFARQRIRVETDDSSRAKQVTTALEPAKIITGRVTYADTHKPVPHAPIQILAYRGTVSLYSEFEKTDSEGRFRVNPLSAERYGVAVLPPEGQPYLNREERFDWTKGALEHSIDVVLPRGAVIHGKVTEAGSGKPLAGARVSYASRPPRDARGASNNRSGTGTDGSFLFAVLPGSGYLVVQAPSDDYVLQEIGSRLVQQGQPGGSRLYAHAFVAGDMKADSTALEINAELRPGVTVKGQVVEPDGKLVQNASMISRVILEPYPGAYRGWRASYQGAVRNGHFELHGLDPDSQVPVFFLEPKRKLGATINLPDKSAADGPIIVRLEWCGTAFAHLVAPGGKPVEGYRASSLIMMVVTPGPATLGRDKESEGRMAAHQGPIADIDPTNYGNGPASDVQGRIALPALIPGATYRIFDRTTFRNESGPQFRKEFTVKSGEILELGDIRIEKPQPLMNR